MHARLTSWRNRIVRAAHRIRGVPPVIVYQMAKVGSTAVVESLTRSGLAPYHVHRMSHEHLARLLETRRAHGWSIPPVPDHDLLGIRLCEKLIRRGRRVRVVTLVREPISRNLSSYFEHLDAIWHVRHAHDVISLDELCRGFVERYTHAEPLTWFDDEILPVLGIDVYDRPFPAEGHITIRTERISLLILKSEMDNAAKSAALSRFFGIDAIVVQSANETGRKSKGIAFRRFVDAIRPSPSYVDEMLNARYTRHFYSDTDRDAMRARWLRPV